MIQKATKWLKAKCPICKQEFEYPEGGYKPSTCSNFDCIHKYLHHPKEYGIERR